MDRTSTEYQLLFFTENYSYYQTGNLLLSPKFSVEGLERTSWFLALWPNQLAEKKQKSLFMTRSRKDAGPENLSVKLEISIITVDESILYSKQCEHTFRKGEIHDFNAFVDMDELFVRRNTDFLPRDTLGLRCRMWTGEERPQRVKKYTARNLLKIEKICFVHKIINFSDLQVYEEKTIRTPSRSKEGCVFSSDLRISALDSPEGSIIVTVRSSNGYHPIMSKRISVISVSGEIRKLVDVDYRFKDSEEKNEEILRSFTRKFFLNHSSEFLPNDELTLLGECTMYIDKEYYKVDEVEIPSYPNVIDDLTEMYNDRLLTDVHLKTATKLFPAHKTVLCARSPVFRSMLSHDMKEKNSDCIQVGDMEDETVHQFLLFLYSDSLEDLQWESALQLYYAADKYEVKSLKSLCSSFLLDNLSTSNVSELQLLADRHSDTELRESVEGFILAHEKVVFSSEEWEKFRDANSQLANKMMQLKHNRNESSK